MYNYVVRKAELTLNDHSRSSKEEPLQIIIYPKITLLLVNPCWGVDSLKFAVDQAIRLEPGIKFSPRDRQRGKEGVFGGKMSLKERRKTEHVCLTRCGRSEKDSIESIPF